jgi:uncharacterized protein
VIHPRIEHGTIRLAQALSGVIVAVCLLIPAPATAQSGGDIPSLTEPVNDFAGVIDAASVQSIEGTIRALQAASGDVIVVATVPTIEPYGDIREYAVRMFQNGGRGIGERGKDNGLLILVAVQQRRVWVEVGYGLEPFVTDGFSGQVSRELMTPQFRNGSYGAGLLAGTNAIAGRIAQGRNVELAGVPVVQVPRQRRDPEFSPAALIVLFILLMIIMRSGGGPRSGMWGRRRGWSRWNSGVGPFGGGFGGGFGGRGGGGFGGGFGGFGGGRSGGGGGGAGW